MTEKQSAEYEKKNGWKAMTSSEKEETFAFCKDYVDFLNAAKTEREAVAFLTDLAQKAGFVDFSDCVSGKVALKPGLGVYSINRGKAMMLAVVGKEDPSTGLNMIGAHLDAPRMDFKPAPIYEDGGFVLAKTHYYGGIKKYQWVTVPMALHGVVIRKDGTKLEIRIGEEPGDPVFYISDILPHLATDQMGKTASNAVSGEQLNVVLSSAAFSEEQEEEKSGLKKALLRLLNERYAITEEDFFRAEIEVVPAAKACDVGFDRSLVGGYGQDDRSCVYTAARALLDLKTVPARTAACYFSDKEEIGSMGNTGARTNWTENFVLELCHAWKDSYEMLAARRALSASRFLSADVTAAFDPCFAEAYDKTNAAYAGFGIALEKYTGSRGKSGASDASAEFVADVIGVFDRENIPWQLIEMGRVDLGGGGTIAQFMTDIGMDVLDCGVPVISMHSPYEVTSKADLYWTYRAYRAFLK